MAAEQASPLAASSVPAWAVVPTTAWAVTTDVAVVVMDMESGVPLQLSPTGSVVWDVLVDGRSPEDDLAAPVPAPLAEDAVIAEVAAAFGEDPATVAEDVRCFLSTLATRGILRAA